MIFEGEVETKQGKEEYIRFASSYVKKEKVAEVLVDVISPQAYTSSMRAIEEKNLSEGIKTNFVTNAMFKDGSVNGFVKDGNIYINVNSNYSLEAISAHEELHYKLSKDKKVAANLFAKTKSSMSKKELDGILESYRNNYARLIANLSEEQAEAYLMEEFLADVYGGMVDNAELKMQNAELFEEVMGAETLAGDGGAKKNGIRFSTDAKIKNHFSAIGSQFQNKTATMHNIVPSKSSSTIDSTISQENDGVKPQKFDRDVRFHISKNAEKEIDKVLVDKTYRQEVKLRDYTPQVLLDHGVKDLPMLMNASHLRQNILQKDDAVKQGFKVNDSQNWHGLGKNLFMQVIDGLDNTREVFRGTKKAENTTRRTNYFLIVSTLSDANGDKINVPVYINDNGRYNDVFIDANKISTVFGRNDMQEYIRKQISSGNLVKIKRKSDSAKGWDQFPPLSSNAVSNEIVTQKNDDVNNEDPRFSLNKNFTKEYDVWDKKNGRGAFNVGRTSEALQSIGMKEQDILWDKSKILNIKTKHVDMSDEVIKQVPQLLENPVLVMQSLTVANRITVLGEVYTKEGKPVLAALELKPRGKNGQVLNLSKIASAHSRHTKQMQYLLDNSEILYVNPDKKRTDTWLKDKQGLQLPTSLNKYGSIGKITYVNKDVKGVIKDNSPGGETAFEIAIKEALSKKETKVKTAKEVLEDPRFSEKPRFSIKTDEQGLPYVKIDKDILEGVEKEDWGRVTREVLKSKYVDGVEIGGRNIGVNSKSKREFTNSKYSRYLEKAKPSLLADKFKIADNLDELLKVIEYNYELPKHIRKDNITGFYRGSATIEIGGKDWLYVNSWGAGKI